MPGPTELILILLIVLVIFGAGKLPAIGDALGRSIKNFRRSTSGQDELEVSSHDALPDAKPAGEIAAGKIAAGVASAVDEADVVSKVKNNS